MKLSWQNLCTLDKETKQATGGHSQ